MVLPRVLLLPILLAASLAAGAVRADEVADAVAQARRQCSANAPALRSRPQLDDAAARLSRGASLQAALQASGYRAQRSVEWRLSGYPSARAVTEMLVRGHCDTLRDPQLTDLGVRHSGTSSWIVVAAPFAPPPQADAASVAARVLALVNRARAQPRQCGDRSLAAVAPLVPDAALTRAAAVHAGSMARDSYLAHEGRDGSSPSQRATRAGYDWRALGENIAMGQTTPELVVQEWLKSPEHCANIMEPAFTQMGVAFGVNPSSEGGIYWAQEFGRPR